MTDFTQLDNPIWHALNSAHKSLAKVKGLAACYSRSVTTFAALQAGAPEAFADLAALVLPKDPVCFFTAEPLDVPPSWQVLFSVPCDQMVCQQIMPPPETAFLELTQHDVPEMLSLTKATEPGPFFPETIKMGRYRGLRSPEGALVAMAGERLRLDGFTEISAVCTDPAFRGLGYGGALVTALAAEVQKEGRTPFLHVRVGNHAKHLYEKLGFKTRRTIHVTVAVQP